MSDDTNIIKNQPDPIAMYIVVREDLNMSAGKVAAQVGHAVEALINIKFDKLSQDDFNAYDLYATSYGRRKIVLKADNNEWAKLKELTCRKSVVVDAGLTEVPAGSETVIALWPMRKSAAQQTILKRLQVLT